MFARLKRVSHAVDLSQKRDFRLNAFSTYSLLMLYVWYNSILQQLVISDKLFAHIKKKKEGFYPFEYFIYSQNHSQGSHKDDQKCRIYGYFTSPSMVK